MMFQIRRILVVLLAAGLVGWSGVAAAETTTLRVGLHISPEHIVAKKGVEPWMAKVAEVAGDRVTLKYFPAEQAAKANAMLDALRDGIIDIGLVPTAYFGDRLPLNSVIALPGFFSDAKSGTAAFEDFMKEGPLRDEFLGLDLVPLMPIVVPPYQVLSKDKRLGAQSDWANLDIRTSGSTQALTARALGGTSVSVAGPEVYAAVERGRVDAVLFPIASVPTFNLQEVVSYVSDNGSFGGFSFILAGRKSVIDALPEDIRKAMVDAGWRISSDLAAANDDLTGELLNQWKAKGINVYSFTPEELKEVNAALGPVKTDWEARVEKQNPKAAEVLKMMEAKASGR